MSGPRARGKRARSRNIIMHAAKGLFEEKGINHVTFNDIAQRADMCRTTIFNHFATINELMLALMEQEVVDVLEHCEESGEHGNDLIVRMFEKLIDDTVQYPVLSSKLLSNSIISEEEAKSVRKLELLIEENLTCPEEEKEDRDIMITGLFYGLVNHYLICAKEFDGNRMKRKFVELVKPYLN